MKKIALLVFLSLVSVPACLRAADKPTPDDIAQCVETTEAVFRHGNDRDPRMLKKYYAPAFRDLLKKGSASPRGEAPFLDADFLRMTQDETPRIVKIGPAVAKDGRVRVPVVLRYAPGVDRTNTAVFERFGRKWLICDLVSGSGSLREELEKEFGN